MPEMPAGNAHEKFPFTSVCAWKDWMVCPTVLYTFTCTICPLGKFPKVVEPLVGLGNRVKPMRDKSPMFAVYLELAMLAKLKVYAGAEHPHAAQQPQELKI